LAVNETNDPEWYYAIGTTQHGPVHAAAIRQMLEAGRLTPESLVWRDGMPQWLRAADVAELAQPVVPIAEPVPPMPPPPPVHAIPYQGPQYGMPRDTSGQATAALVLGIVSIVTCWCPLIGLATGIPAWVMGAKYQIGPNGGSAKAGMILGIIGTILSGMNSCFGVLTRLGKL
jgi:hypothetical protein